MWRGNGAAMRVWLWEGRGAWSRAERGSYAGCRAGEVTRIAKEIYLTFTSVRGRRQMSEGSEWRVE